MILSRAQLLTIMPHAGAQADIYLSPLNAAMAECQITTAARTAAFLPNVAVESSQLHAVSEDLNYSAQGLANTWPARYAMPGGHPPAPNALARALAHDPERIANDVYANRMGNGPAESGDGWAHRGAGLIELTGKAIQIAAAIHFGIAPEAIADWLRTPEGASRSAAWYFASRGCNTYADNGDFDGVCDVINIGRKTPAIGDAIGYAARLAFAVVARRTFTV